MVGEGAVSGNSPLSLFHWPFLPVILSFFLLDQFLGLFYTLSIKKNIFHLFRSTT
jgi:hypothetical protein